MHLSLKYHTRCGATSCYKPSYQLSRWTVEQRCNLEQVPHHEKQGSCYIVDLMPFHQSDYIVLSEGRER